MAPKKENKKQQKQKKKNNARRKKNKKQKSRQQNGSFFFKFIKWMFVLGLWVTLAFAGMVAWYAKDLSEITSSPQFERRTAITVKAADGSKIARYGELKSVPVTLEELPSELIYAVMAIEDRCSTSISDSIRRHSTGCLN